MMNAKRQLNKIAFINSPQSMMIANTIAVKVLVLNTSLLSAKIGMDYFK
jgi:hypothetical protein